MHPTPPLLLAQFGQPAAVKPLPSPPFLDHYTLEDPLPLAALLVAAGVVTFFLLNRRGRARRGLVLAAQFCLTAAGVWLVSTLVETDRERAADATSRLIGAAARVDIPTIDRLLAPDAAAFYFDARGGLNKPEILDRVKSQLGGAYRVQNPAVLETQALRDPSGTVRIQTRVRVNPEGTEYPVISWWRLDWRPSATGEWRCFSIELLSLEGVGTP